MTVERLERGCIVPAAPSIELTADERSVLGGEAGSASQLAMRILSRVAPFYGASTLMPVTRAHIDGCIYQGEAGLEFAERLASAGGRVSVPTSLNVISLDRERWRTHGLDSDYADRARRLGQAYLDMGATPTFTCAPYQNGVDLDFGEQVAWSESNAVAFANTVTGARSNRYGDFLDVCCAITGRVPASGLHLDGPRRGTLRIELTGVHAALQSRDDFWPVLGYRIGGMAQGSIPVIVGIDVSPSVDQLKSFCAAAATSGAVALTHIVGVTPEAPTERDAFGGRTPERSLGIDLGSLLAARRELSTSADGSVDLVGFGSPHASVQECRTLAGMMRGRQASPNVRVWITTSRGVRQIIERSGELADLEAFGATVTADTCIIAAPLVGDGHRVLMTNSAKYAHYAPGLIGTQTVFGSTEDCVESAVLGRVVVDESAWTA